MRVAGRWDLGDHLQFEGSGALLFTRHAAARDLLRDFRDGAAGRVSYAWDSATIASGSVRRWWFTDGNDRIEASGFLVARVIERHDLTLDLRPELWWGANTRLDAPYFNPSRSASADMSATAQHRLWRRYERSLRQELRLAIGAVAQQDVSTRWTGLSRTKKIFQLTTGSSVDYGVGYARRVYDGNPVEDLRVWVNLGHRFP